MRTLGDILEAVKANQAATEEELRYALLAADALRHFDHSFLFRFAGPDAPNALRAKMEGTETFNRAKRAFAVDPKSYVGWNNDPANPEYQKRRAVALKIFDKAMRGELPNQKGRASDG